MIQNSLTSTAAKSASDPQVDALAKSLAEALMRSGKVDAANGVIELIYGKSKKKPDMSEEKGEKTPDSEAGEGY